MIARRIVDPELVSALDARLPKEISDLILEQLPIKSREVARVFNENILEIEWDEGTTATYGNDEVKCLFYFIRYKCEVERFVTLCPSCGVIGSTDFWTLNPREEFQDCIQCNPRWDLCQEKHECGKQGKYKYNSDQWNVDYLLPLVSPDKMVLREIRVADRIMTHKYYLGKT